MKKLRWVAFLLTIVALVSLVPVQSLAQVNFSDVKTSDEFYNEVNYIANLGIIKGYTENGNQKYKPNENIKRSQVAKMLVIATGNDNYNASNIVLKDVKAGTEEYKYISQAVALGYLKTNADGSIKPFEFIKRSELGYALSIAFDLSEGVTATRPMVFPDVKKHVEQINGLYYAGITQGSQGKFGPDKLLTRGQFALFIARALDDTYTLPVKLPDQTGATFFVKVKTGSDTLNIRSIPSSNGAITGKLSDGEIVEVISQTGDWLHIVNASGEGYIHSRYTVKVENNDQVEDEKDNEALPDEDFVVGDLIGKVTAKSLNVRSGPNTTSPVIAKLTLGEKVEVLALDGYWATIQVGSDTGYVHKTFLKLINKSKLPLKDRIIVIDAGHGGGDPGTSKNGVTEKSIVLKVSTLVEEKLQRAGAKVLMTRSADTFPSLQQRTDYAKKNYAETFVSIHVNSAAASSAKGTEVFYNSSTNQNATESRLLATYIQNNIVKQADMTNRGVKDSRFYVITNNDVAAVLVELGFITNSDDFAKLTSDKYLEIYAEAIFQGLLQYYSAS